MSRTEREDGLTPLKLQLSHGIWRQLMQDSRLLGNDLQVPSAIPNPILNAIPNPIPQRYA